MKTRYISKIDNKSFSTEEDLVLHLLANFSMKDNKEGKVSQILAELLKEFPFAKIDIKEIDGKEGYGEFHISMLWDEFESEFGFYVGEYSKDSYYDFHFKSLQDAINHYKLFLSAKDEIIYLLKNKYDLKSVEIQQMYDGNYDSDSGIYFTFEKDGNTYGEHYHLGKPVQSFIDSFDGHFKNVIEGDLDIERDSMNHSVEYYVGNVPLSTMIRRAKRMRIEILETK